MKSSTLIPPKSRSILLFVVNLFFTIACQHDDLETPVTAVEDECLSTSSSRNGQSIDGEFIVKLSSTTVAEGRDATTEQIRSHHLLSKERILQRLDEKNNVVSVRLSLKEVEELKSSGKVAAIESDRIVSICGCFTVVEPRTITWNVNRVGFGDGRGKTAWVIDTGIDSDHPDLKVDKTRSRSFINGSSIEDDNGHGTHVAGIIAAVNNDIGTLGVASGATVVALKVLEANGEGKLSGVLNALSYIGTHAKAGDVVNISIGFPETSEILENSIRSLANKGIYFALAAGNESGEANSYSPARTSGPNIFTVSAVDSLNRFARFSNYGNDVIDYAAPGVRILSTYMDGKYAILSGTSQAAPHVAGILLLNRGKVNSNGSASGDPDGTPDPLAHY